MHQTWFTPVDETEGLRGGGEGDLVGRELTEWQFTQELAGSVTPTVERPLPRQASGDRRHLGAADGQPTPVEVGTEWKRNQLGAVPRHDERGPLVPQELEAVHERARISARLHQQRRALGRRHLGDACTEVLGHDRRDPETAGQLTARRHGITREHAGTTTLEEQAAQEADHTQAGHHDDRLRLGLRLQADLKRRLDQWKERGLSQVYVADRDRVASGDDEPVLVGMEREHRGALGYAIAGLLDSSDAAVAVPKREAELAREGRKGVVEGEALVELASVGEHFGAGTDARERGPDKQFPRTRLGKRRVTDLDPAGLDEPHGLGFPVTHWRPLGTDRPVSQRCAPRVSIELEKETRVLETREVTRVMLPTPFGPFRAHAFESSTGAVHLVLVKGQVSEHEPVLTRLHSECITGDALGSLRCDCGVQLRLALRMIAAAGAGVLVYTTGHEGRGIGLMNKLRAYVEQDNGADTVDANFQLGLPIDARSYDDVPAILRELGVRSVRLLTNNPVKVDALRTLGIAVDEIIALPTAPHTRNLRYLRTKHARLGHLDAIGDPLPPAEHRPPAVADLMGPVRPRVDRPYVVLKYAQTLDGRIATATGDAKWISSEAERVVSHGLRAACDAVLVGVDTVIQDDPQLTVRMVSGASPVRIVLDTTLRVPRDAKILGDDAATIIITTDRASATAHRWLASRHVAVHAVDAGADGVDIGAALALLRTLGTESLLVEGGGKVITSLLRAQVVDRLVVGVAPTIIGAGTDAVGDLGVAQVTDGVRLHNRVTCIAGDDLLVAFDLEPSPPHSDTASN